MKSKTKIFNIKLNVLTPIHIGDGSTYNPTDYEIDNNELHVIDHEKFIKKINSNKALYNDFLARIKNFTPKSIDLVNFIREHSKGLYKYSIKLDNEAFDYIKKSPTEIDRAPIDKFIRNPFSETIYIPGSSIKGALRSAIIEVIFRKIIPKEDSKCEYSKEREEILKGILSFSNQNDKNSNQQNLHLDILLNKNFKLHDAKNDLLRHVFVSDFLPERASLEICFPINKNKDNDKKNNIPALLECAMPKSVFEGTISFKEEFFIELNDILSRLYNKLNKESKKTQFDEFDEKLLAKWIKVNYKNKVYNCEKITVNHDNKENNFIIKIGKHAGALSKSIAGLRKIKINAFNFEKGYKEKSVSNSQTTFWYINDKPMGWILGEVVGSKVI